MFLFGSVCLGVVGGVCAVAIGVGPWIDGVGWGVATGHMGVLDLEEPWVPDLGGIPARRRDPAVGAST